MDIDIPFTDGSLSSISNGDWFAIYRDDGPIWSFKVSDGSKDSAVVFYPRPNRSAFPWLAINGFPNDSLVVLPKSIVRTEFSCMRTSSPEIGQIIIGGGKRYMRVADDHAHYRVFNLETGLMEEIPESYTPVVATTWQLGYEREGRFQEVYRFA